MPPAKSKSSKPKVTLYHSELVSMGPVQIKIVGEVRASKYPGKPPYLDVEVNGEKRQYWIDNDDIGELLDGRAGQLLMVEAGGNKGNETLQIVGEGAASQEPEEKPWKNKRGQAPAEPPQQQQQQSLPATAAGNDDRYLKARKYACKFNNALRYGFNLAYLNATELQAMGLEIRIEDIRAWATSIAMALEKAGQIAHFPSKPEEMPFKIEPPKKTK